MSDFKDIKHPELAAIMWDWSEFRDCFDPTKISLTDCDGWVERNGYFLIVETKFGNAPLPQGQRIMLEKLAAKPEFTVIVVWGARNKPTKLQYIGNETVHIADLHGMKTHVCKWFQRVDALPEYKPSPQISDSDFYNWFKKLPLDRLWKLLRTIQDYMDELTDYQAKYKAS